MTTDTKHGAASADTANLRELLERATARPSLPLPLRTDETWRQPGEGRICIHAHGQFDWLAWADLTPENCDSVRDLFALVVAAVNALEGLLDENERLHGEVAGLQETLRTCVASEDALAKLAAAERVVEAAKGEVRAVAGVYERARAYELEMVDLSELHPVFDSAHALRTALELFHQQVGS